MAVVQLRTTYSGLELEPLSSSSTRRPVRGGVRCVTMPHTCVSRSTLCLHVVPWGVGKTVYVDLDASAGGATFALIVLVVYSPRMGSTYKMPVGSPSPSRGVVRRERDTAASAGLRSGPTQAGGHA